MLENEKIETSASGSVQVLFVDKTTLNIGPNSSLVIDHFVYDAKAGTGQVALSLGKGVLRVVGGFATHTGGATIATPAASIGLRGGIATIEYHPGEGVRAVLGYGHLSMSTLCRGAASCGGNTVDLYRPGYMAQASGPGQSPSQPVRANEQDIDRANGQLTSRFGQHGGSRILPTDHDAENHGIGKGGSQDAASQFSPPAINPAIIQQFQKPEAPPPPVQIVSAPPVVAPPPPPTCDKDGDGDDDCHKHHWRHHWWWWRHEGWRHDREHDRWARDHFDDRRRDRPHEEQRQAWRTFDQSPWKSFDHPWKSLDHPWKNFATWRADRRSLPISDLIPTAHPPIDLKQPVKHTAL